MESSKERVQALKATVLDAASQISGLCHDFGLQELTSDLEAIVGKMNQGLFVLVVMGEIKKGKTSFINALLGLGDLLPTDTDIATSTVYKIIHGPRKRIRIFFKQDLQTGHTPEPLEISDAQISEYGTEKGNPQNAKRVDFIALEHPAEILASGLCIVDTPGVGGLYKAHLGVTWKYAPNADAIFFVLDSVETVISEDEIRFLGDLTSKISQRVYFIQTKKDKAGRQQVEAWEQRNRALLLEHLPVFNSDTLKYFVISSKLKQGGEKSGMLRMIEDSGYPRVQAFLEDDLIANKDRMLCQEAATLLQAKLGLLRGRIASSLQASTAETQELVRELERCIQQKRMELASWEKTAFQDLQRTFSDHFQEAKQIANDRLNDILDPNTPDLTSFLEELRKRGIAAKDLNTEIAAYQQKWVAVCSERGKEVLAEFEKSLKQRLGESIVGLESHVDVNQFLARLGTLKVNDWGSGVSRHESLNLNLNSFQATRNAVAGATVGSTVAAIAGNLLLPWLGGLVAGLLVTAAGAYSAKLAHDGLEADRKTQALNQIERILRETIAAVRKNALRDFGRMATDYEKQLRELFRTAVRATHDRYEAEAGELQETRRSTAAELKAKADASRLQLRKVDDIAKSLLLVMTES